MKYKGILASSSDPTGQTLSATVQGLIVVLSAIVPMLAMQYFHVVVTANDVSSLVTEVVSLVGIVLTIRGGILKILNTVGTTA